MNFESNRGDPDVRTRLKKDPLKGDYREWILCYVDDLLAISRDPAEIMKETTTNYDLKESVGPPKRYLGGNVRKWQLPDGSHVIQIYLTSLPRH